MADVAAVKKVYSLDEVVNLLETEESLDEDMVVDDTDVTGRSEGILGEKLEKCLRYFDTFFAEDLGDNVSLFKKHARQYLEGTLHVFLPPTDPLKIMLNMPLNIGAILKQESRFWLVKIAARLRGKSRVRTPYLAEFTRDIPEAVFSAVKSGIVHSTEKTIYGNITTSQSKKESKVCFMSVQGVTLFLSMLSGFTKHEIVGKYLTKDLRGRFQGKAKLLVSSSKNFIISYSHRSLQLKVIFHYGVWNSYGFPQHTV